MGRRTTWTSGAALAACAAAVTVALGGTAALAPVQDARAATTTAAAADWPVPLPDWFWRWARWYLGRGEFAAEPLRDPSTRPGEAPRAIPTWAWRRLAVLLGEEPPPTAEPEPERPQQQQVRTWPLPVPQWFWTWARWYLGRGEFAGEPLQTAATRPAAAPGLVPEWAWHRLAVLEGGTPPAPPTRSLSAGASGVAVEGVQRALNAAGYPAGPIDGSFGAKTRDAVLAWEKVHRRTRDGVVSTEEYPLIVRTLRPSPPVPGSEYVYVDLERQVLFEVRGGRVTSTIGVSTGGGYRYTGDDGTRRTAVTPRGSYRVFRKVSGWDESYLGRLYYPSYYSGGYAIHGAVDVPPRPVSHGCVRIPVWLAVEFYERTAIGTRVIIR